MMSVSFLFDFQNVHCVKSVRIQSFSGTYFPAFGKFSIQSECGKIRTRKTPNTDIFHAVIALTLFSLGFLGLLRPGGGGFPPPI